MKLLVISTVGLKMEGITNVILSYLEHMDLKRIKVYVVGTIVVDEIIREKIEQLNCEIVILPSRKECPLLYFYKLAKFIRKEKIDIVHAHGNSATLAIEMIAAWLGGCSVRIAHSHNTKCDQIRLDKLLRPLFYQFYTDGIACSTEAGQWLFQNRKFKILNNGRNLKTFSYNKEVRAQIRRKLGVDDKIVIGHVGGFIPQKNHQFLIEIFKEIHKLCPQSAFVMMGDGYLRNDVEKRAEELGILPVVKFTGNICNVNEIIQGVDGMVLPSLFEGLPLVAVEWQIAALPSLLSECISHECATTSLVEFCSLEESSEVWARKILSMVYKNKREDQKDIVLESIRAAGFDITEIVKELENFYFVRAGRE